MARPGSRGLRCVDCRCLRDTGMIPRRVYHPTDLALTCIRRRRKSLVALSSNLLRKAKIASVRLHVLPPHHVQQLLTPQPHSLAQGSKLRPSRSPERRRTAPHWNLTSPPTKRNPLGQYTRIPRVRTCTRHCDNIQPIAHARRHAAARLPLGGPFVVAC